MANKERKGDDHHRIRGVARRPPSRDARLAIIVFCEGAVTEPAYFRGFARDYGNMLVSVEIVKAAGVPVTLVDSAVARMREIRNSKNSFERKDQCWAVFDCDDHVRVPDAIQRARDAGVGVAYSNPCFELWAVLHFEDHDAPDGRRQIQKRLEQLMPKYKPDDGKLLDYSSVASTYPTAVGRAKKMTERRIAEGCPLGNPFTGVHLLTETIRENGKA